MPLFLGDAKDKSKNRTPPAQAQAAQALAAQAQAAQDQAAQAQAEQAPGADSGATAVVTKSLYELSVDELRKECVKLGIILEEDKPKKEICISKLAVFLICFNFNMLYVVEVISLTKKLE